MSPVAGLSFMRTPGFGPVVEEQWARGRIGALELTLEWAFGGLAEEELALVERAEAAGALLGHGVHYSPLSARWSAMDSDWLRRVTQLASERRFRWVTEHFGCCRAGGVWGAPLPVPFTRLALERGHERLDRLAQAVGVPVGLENLAFAWSSDDCLRQADFVDALLVPVDGLMLLDLHNLWCQAVNYGFDPVALLERQPLERVRQIHVAGGSVSQWPEGDFRRDTHDGPVPGEVWALLPEAMARCPGLEVVSLERLGPAIEADPAGWAWEVDALATAVSRSMSELPVAAPARSLPGEGEHAHDWDRLFQRAGAEPSSLRAAAPGWLSEADDRALRTASTLLATWGRPHP